MNKSELIDAIAKKSALTKVETQKALDAFMSVVKDELKKDGKITLVGFGSFSVAERAARTGRNPKTGKELKIPAKKVVKFKAGSELSEVVTKKK